MKTINRIIITILVCAGSMPAVQGQYYIATQGAPCSTSMPVNITNNGSSPIASNIWNISWKFNGNTISGTTSQTTMANGSGTYSASFCIGTSTGSCITYTASANLTLQNNTYYIVGPQMWCSGQSVTYTLSVIGVGGWGAGWYVNGTSVGSASSPYTTTTMIPGSTIAVSGSSACGSVSASLQTSSTLAPPPPVLYATGDPSQFCAANNSNVLNVAGGSNFQWKLDGTSITGATNSIYHPTLSGNYSVVALNSCINANQELGPINVAMQANCLPPPVWSITGGNLASTSNDLMVNGNTRLNGKLLTLGMKITLTPGIDAFPDYVFSKGYKLKPLEELKTYIDTHNHLPEVPTAKEVEAEGMDIKQMNLILLKKLEENTLYVLELNKRIQAQQKEMDAMQKELKAQKKIK